MVSVLGIVGPIGSGKDTVTDYIAQKYGYAVFSFRDMIADMMKKEGIEPNRENMQQFGRQIRDERGEDVFSLALLERIVSSKCEKALVKELRTASDVKIIWSHFKSSMKIIKVVAPTSIRFERMRARQRTGDPKILKEFMQQEKKEEDLGYTKAFNFADFVVFNTGSKEYLYDQVDKLMNSLNQRNILFRRRFLG